MGDIAGEPTRIVRPGDNGAASTSPPVPGQRWGKFLIEKRLGAGGQAEVFQAFDQFGTAGHVALKVPAKPIPPEHIQRWVDTEAGALVKLQHPNIVRVLAAGVVGSLPYVATELLEGLPINEQVRTTRPTLRRILDWMIQLADALHAAHRRGIVHRDVKPGNIVITPQGEPLLLDFGVASLVSAYQREPRRDRSGTYPFMAPEQARRSAEADHRVDVFGLGAILKFLLVGQPPYHGARDALQAAGQGKVVLISDRSGPAVRRALCRIANRALDPDPAKRYQTAREMAAALRRVRARRTVIASVAAAASLILIAILAFRAWAEPSGEPEAAGQAALVRAVASPQAVQASLEIHFQRKGQVGSYEVLSADALPLRTGDRIQIHARLAEPLIAYLVAVGSEGATLLYPLAGEGPQPVTEIDYPTGGDEWLPLVPPAGTETILLLGRREPLDDADAFLNELLSLGPPPVLEGAGLYLVDDAGPRFLPGRLERPLGEEPVTVEKGFLAELLSQVPEKWLVVRAVAFPHQGGGQ